MSTTDHDGHDHSHDHAEGWKAYLPAIISGILLVSGLALEYLFSAPFFKAPVDVIWYGLAFLPVGWPVLKDAFHNLLRGNFFTEFFLMSLATIGAFYIGEYPEGVAVMLFYAIGELFQSAAVSKAKGNIQKLLDVRPKVATVFRNNNYTTINPEEVLVGEKIQVRLGEKVPLDGKLLTEHASLNTAALTGESKPATLQTGERVLAGSINLGGVIEVEVTQLFNNSSIARILELVQNATSRKSETELLIRRLAKIYTPIVVGLAVLILVLPYFIVSEYDFNDWLYRSLIFLVISCPCALVISIPLGYFGGLGAASQEGLLFKGATFLDQITKVTTLVMDKTGTVTKGVFKINNIVTTDSFGESEFMQLLMALEQKSTHPIAKAILEYPLGKELPEATDISEIPGKGLKGVVSGKELLVGNKKLMRQFNIEVPVETDKFVKTIVMVAIDQRFAGYVVIADQLKEDAMNSITRIRKAGIQKIHMLSGDKDAITQEVAAVLQLDSAKGDLLPEDKLNEVEQLKKANPNNVIAFVGDGINDVPVLALSDIGIAMGGLGSDVAIETADVIIQTDQPSKIATAVKIGKATQRIIWQNIALAFGVKFIVMALGAGGIATMWETVFADVGVALLAILNAVRLQRMSWNH